jgi:type IX secretion system PorP/SprF family membrane protein
MLKRLTLATVILFSMLMCDSAFAQDPQFTQFYANPLYLNPAFAGTARCPRVILNYRNQWPAISGTFVTYSASYDQHIDNLSGGIGLLVTNDKAGEGTLNTTNFSGIYSYQLNINRRFSIKAGFQATYAQKSVDWNKLTFGDMIDPRRGFVYTSAEQQNQLKRSNVDISAGLLGYSKVYFFGASVHHLTEPDEGFLGQSKLPMKYTVHAGAVIPIEKDESSISPNILFQKQQDFQQLCLGLYLTKGPIVGGLWYRNQDSFIALIGFQQGLVKFGYSYDVTVSKLSNATAGSHELSFAMQFECKPKKKKFRTISCPSF